MTDITVVRAQQYLSAVLLEAQVEVSEQPQEGWCESGQLMLRVPCSTRMPSIRGVQGKLVAVKLTGTQYHHVTAAVMG